MKKIIRLTESDLTRLVRRTIMEMESEDRQSMLENMIDEIGEEVIENSYFGSLTEDDMEGFASTVSEIATDRIQQEFPNMKVDYTLYYGGDLEFYIFDNDEEEIVSTYRPSF